MTVDPYARTEFRGKPLDNATAYACMEAERLLDYQLTVVQGIGGAAASSGTHLEGRAVDLASWDAARKVRVLRDLGFAAWYRPELPGVWGPHVHAVLILESRDNRRGLAPAGFDQIGKYDRGEDGLANPPTRDPNPYRPSPKAVYTLAEFREDTMPEPTQVQKMRNAMVEARHALGDAIALGKDADGRPVAQAAVPKLVEQRAELTTLLEHMPMK